MKSTEFTNVNNDEIDRKLRRHSDRLYERYLSDTILESDDANDFVEYCKQIQRESKEFES